MNLSSSTAVLPLIDDGEGTAEADWARCPRLGAVRSVALDHLVPPGRRAVIVAPHPDDEVLAVGGLVAQLSRAGRGAMLVAVTDGSASHPHSTHWTPERLAHRRTAETERALALLGFQGVTVRLGFPDGELSAKVEPLHQQLTSLLSPDDVIFTTWRLDGHPDHEATGRACASAALQTGARLLEVPVWGWHWAAPADHRFPWHRACRLALDEDALRRKCEAVQTFESQLAGDRSTGQQPVLRRSTVERAARGYEVMFE